MDDRLNDYDQKLLEFIRNGTIPDVLVSPLFVLWDLTFSCNHACLHCFNNSGRGGAMMSRNQALTLAKELAEACVHSVCVSGGEAILCPHYFEVIETLSQGGVIVSTITNGFQWGEDTAYRLKRSGVENVQVSIDGSNAQTHDRIHGRQGAFVRALRAAEQCIEEGLHLDIAFTPMKLNKDEYGDAIDMAADIGARNFRSMPLMPTGRAYHNMGELCLDESEEKVLADVVLAKTAKYRNRIEVVYASPIHHYSYFGRVPVFFAEVLPDGLLRVSPYLNVVCGNVLEDGFLSAWQKGACRSWSHPYVLKRAALVTSVRDFAEKMPPAWVSEDVHLDFAGVEGPILCRVPEGIY